VPQPCLPIGLVDLAISLYRPPQVRMTAQARGSPGQHVQLLVRPAYEPAGFGEFFGVAGGLDQAAENTEPRGQHVLVEKRLRITAADKGPVEPVVHQRVGNALQVLGMGFTLEQRQDEACLILRGRRFAIPEMGNKLSTYPVHTRPVETLYRGLQWLDQRYRVCYGAEAPIQRKSGVYVGSGSRCMLNKVGM